MNKLEEKLKEIDDNKEGFCFCGPLVATILLCREQRNELIHNLNYFDREPTISKYDAELLALLEGK